MPTEHELVAERKRKLQLIRERGINPYPYKYDVTAVSSGLHEKYDGLKAEEHTQDTVSVAGRIVGLRRMGKITFMHLQDDHGKIQCYFRKDGKADYTLLKLLDRGDWVGVKGTVFKTKTGEVTIEAQDITILSKSLRPLPEKWHGLKDTEIRYRKRYLDLVANPQIKHVFIHRTKIMDAIRKTLNERGFLEVETPILSAQYGGANARPFSSHLNALDMTVYMRISNELFLKRLIMGGFEKVYEFSKDFRNEGIDRSHNPEFTQIEIYEAHKDLYDVMELTEQLIIAALKAVGKKSPITWGEHTINIKAPFERLRMVDAIQKYAGINVNGMSAADLKATCKSHNVEWEGESKGMLILALFEGLVEHKFIDPVFITEHPKETTPLCKVSREDPEFVERFELFIGGMEFANAYSELNDPIRQRELLEEQAKALRGGSEEAHPMDEDFVEAMEYGMPPTGGVGIGIDRLVMLLCDQHSIRDVLLFPFMKPVDENEHEKHS